MYVMGKSEYDSSSSGVDAVDINRQSYMKMTMTGLTANIVDGDDTTVYKYVRSTRIYIHSAEREVAASGKRQTVCARGWLE
jgi:hypothetical protein